MAAIRDQKFRFSFLRIEVFVAEPQPGVELVIVVIAQH